MGASYIGDIKGKLGFGRGADSPDRFGFSGEQPNYLEYYYDRDNFVVDELKSIIEKLNEGALFISKFIKGDTYSITDNHAHYTNKSFKTEELKSGLKLEEVKLNELVDKIEDLYCVFYCFEENDERGYESSIFGMRLDGLSNEETDTILKYIKERKLVEEFEDAILGAKIYVCVQKYGECNFNTIY